MSGSFLEKITSRSGDQINVENWTPTQLARLEKVNRARKARGNEPLTGESAESVLRADDMDEVLNTVIARDYSDLSL
jgi:hypothetical protein